MSLFSKIGSFLKPIATTVLKAVAPAAAEALKGVVGNGLQSIFEAGSKGLQGILGGVPLVGPLLSNLVGKYAPGLLDVAKNFANGGIDKLLALITGQPTARPVPGTDGQVITAPPISTRGPEIIANTPNPSGGAPSTGTQASTGSGTTGTSGNSSSAPSGGYPKYPEPLTGADAKDLGKQNAYNAQMMEYQQQFQAIQLNFQTQTTMMKASKDTISSMIRNMA